MVSYWSPLRLFLCCHFCKLSCGEHPCTCRHTCPSTSVEQIAGSGISGSKDTYIESVEDLPATLPSTKAASNPSVWGHVSPRDGSLFHTWSPLITTYTSPANPLPSWVLEDLTLDGGLGWLRGIPGQGLRKEGPESYSDEGRPVSPGVPVWTTPNDSQSLTQLFSCFCPRPVLGQLLPESQWGSLLQPGSAPGFCRLWKQAGSIQPDRDQ